MRGRRLTSRECDLWGSEGHGDLQTSGWFSGAAGQPALPRPARILSDDAVLRMLDRSDGHRAFSDRPGWASAVAVRAYSETVKCRAAGSAHAPLEVRTPSSSPAGEPLLDQFQ
jgi:hypothetical protein